MIEIVEPTVELLKQGEDWKAHVARCARVCYGKEFGDNERTIKHLFDRQHFSPFRHESVYAIIPKSTIEYKWFYVYHPYEHCPYINVYIDIDNVYISTNGNFLLDCKENDNDLYKILIKYRVTSNKFKCISYTWEHLMRHTFIIETQISTSRELNRVSPNNICEASTRYIEGKHIIARPHWMDKDIAEIINSGIYTIDNIGSVTDEYIRSCERSFRGYDKLRTAGMKPQDARGTLPLDTYTKVAYTYTIDEWRDILDLRYYGTTGQPHPNAKIIAGLIRDNLINEGYEFRNE